MKIAHISDLHLGKIVNGFSMVLQQEYIIGEIIRILKEHDIKTLLISGDVFDKNIASIDGLRLYDKFIDTLHKEEVTVFIISGNHDSLERLTCGSKLMRGSNIYIGRGITEDENKYKLKDEFGCINVYLLPFIKPVTVKNAYDVAPVDYSDAVEMVINKMNVNTEERNILLAHQYVTGATRSESEEIFVGGLDNVNANVFEPFDYVALGHLHKAQYVERETVRYCGTPLKYSIAEKNDKKSMTIVNMLEKGHIEIDMVPLIPKNDICEIKGKYNDLMSFDFYGGLDKDAYYSIILTDDNYIMDVVGRMRSVYKNIMSLTYENTRTLSSSNVEIPTVSKSKNPCDYIEDLFKAQNNCEMTGFQKKMIEDIMDELEESR